MRTCLEKRNGHQHLPLQDLPEPWTFHSERLAQVQNPSQAIPKQRQQRRNSVCLRDTCHCIVYKPLQHQRVSHKTQHHETEHALFNSMNQNDRQISYCCANNSINRKISYRENQYGCLDITKHSELFHCNQTYEIFGWMGHLSI